MSIRHLVTPPIATPRRFGLFSQVEIRTPQVDQTGIDQHWRLGVRWQSQNCAETKITTSDCLVDGETTESGNEKDPDGYCEVREFSPFTVYAYNDDDIPGATLAQHEANAIARLVNDEQRSVEVQVWADILAEAGAPGDLTMFTAKQGLGALEATWAAQYGITPVVHMSVAAATVLGECLYREGGRLFTYSGTPVIIGGGYGSATDTPDTATIALTGPMIMYRGEINTQANAVAKATNQVSIIAERDYVVGWDCNAYAVTISLCHDCSPTQPET
jgi:hypothetical protein